MSDRERTNREAWMDEENRIVSFHEISDSRYYSAFPQALSTLSRVLSQGGGNAVGMREKLPRLIAVLEKMDKVYTLGGKTSVESLNQFYRDWAPLYDELDAILRE